MKGAGNVQKTILFRPGVKTKQNEKDPSTISNRKKEFSDAISWKKHFKSIIYT